MRKLNSILLVLCLCCTCLGYHLVFHIQLTAVKSEMRAFLLSEKGQKEVIRFSFSSEESMKLEWEGENEFSYNGEMYDVIAKEKKENLLVLRCIEDRRETALLQEFRKNTRQNSSNASIAQLITAPFILPSDYPLQKPESIIKRNFIQSSSPLLKTVATVPSPPPDGC